MASYTGTARRALRKRVPAQVGTGFSTEPDGFEVAEIRVTVDMKELTRIYGVAAMGNKSGKSRYMGGCVVLEVISRRKET